MLLALKGARFEEAIDLIEQQVRSGYVSAVSLTIHDPAGTVNRAFGKASGTDAVFLIASLTKPMTASALMILVDRKEVALSDRVQRFIPEFRGEGRERVLVKHLLTHTSGLPDMLPNDHELRKRHAPLANFVAETCRTPLLFAPGTQWRYQSMGILLAGEVVKRVSKQPLPTFLRDQVYEPLRMKSTSLGLGGREISKTMQCQVDQVSDWDWNSAYWRNLASPWGGSLSTGNDLVKFLTYFAHPYDGILKTATALAMISDQTPGLSRRWGFGWMLNNATFGPGCSPVTFGHEGSTGCLCWCDPKKDASFVLLTTKPAEYSGKTLLSPVSDLVSNEV
jgi:CubicO group peptidase (beta-lactamase class C family)